MTTHEIRAAGTRGQSQTDTAKARAHSPYVWDGKHEDERPLTREEMQAGIDVNRKQRGRFRG